MTLDSSKTLGGIGAILLFIGVITFFAQPLLAILGLIGIILVLVALHDLANNYKEGGTRHAASCPYMCKYRIIHE